MRRISAGLLCLLLIGGLVPVAAAKNQAGAEIVRGAGALWWRHDGKAGTLYYLDVYDSLGGYSEKPHATRGYFGAIPCGVGNRGRWRDCDWRLANIRRVKVASFEIDPVMSSAHAVLRSGQRRGEVTWTGRGDYYKPFLWEHAGQFADPPYFAQVSAGFLAFTGRDASARGDLFGLDLTRNEFTDAGMVDILYASASACVGGPWCDLFPDRAR